MSPWYTELAVGMGGKVLEAITPDLRQMLVDFVKQFKIRADATPNPLDDVIAILLHMLLGIKAE